MDRRCPDVRHSPWNRVLTIHQPLTAIIAVPKVSPTYRVAGLLFTDCGNALSLSSQPFIEIKVTGTIIMFQELKT